MADYRQLEQRRVRFGSILMRLPAIVVCERCGVVVEDTNESRGRHDTTTHGPGGVG